MAQWTPDEQYLLGKVLPGIAAQLRMPLNNLAMAMQCILPEEQSGSQRQNLAVFQQSYYRILRLVNHLNQAPELLDSTPLEKENTEVCAFFEDIAIRAKDLFAEKDVTLSFSCSEQYHITALHRDYTSRMLWNLLSNALKYTPAGGNVTLTVKTVAGQLLISVSDDGKGISPEEMDKVFDRWHHAEENTLAGQGFGLGLPLSCHIAERQGGRLLLNLRPTGGTVATVSLPDEHTGKVQVRQQSFDYAGGFRQELMELCDALPYSAFMHTGSD